MPMPDPAPYLERLEAAPVKAVEVGHQTVELLGQEELADAQVGFAVDADGNDVTGSRPGEWRPTWLVIALEESLGDPVFVDTADDALPVLWVGHDMDWSAPQRLADSFEGFAEGLRLVHEAAGGRRSPVDLEQNPLPDDELDRLIARIRERNPGADGDFWRAFFCYGED